MGVCFSSFLLLAFVANGPQGVPDMLNILSKERKRKLSITGCRDIAGIDSSIIRSL